MEPTSVKTTEGGTTGGDAVCTPVTDACETAAGMIDAILAPPAAALSML